MAKALLSEIEAFLEETGMGPSYFGVRSVRNSDLVKRLAAGGRVWPETEMKVRAFILSERSKPARKSRQTSGEERAA
jgi:hypothetical protein